MRCFVTATGGQGVLVPTLDRINGLMSMAEAAGQEPRGLLVGNREAEQLTREVVSVRTDDRYTAVDPIETTALPELNFGCDLTFWGVPVLRVDQDNALAVVTDG